MMLVSVKLSGTSQRRHPEGRQRLEQIGFTVLASSSEEYAAFQREEVERRRGVVRTAGIKAE